MPQVGYREGFGELGYTFRPKGKRAGPPVIHRLRIFTFSEYQVDREGDVINQMVSAGFGMSGKWDSFFRFRLAHDEVRSGGQLFPRDQAFLRFHLSPTRAISDIRLRVVLGDDVDFANDRPATGGTLGLAATFRPNDRLEFRLDSNRRWLDVDRSRLDEVGRERLFTATVARLRTTYNLSSRSYVRLIGQYVETGRDPTLDDDEVDSKSAFLSTSALFAYKLNWQTVLFLGFGDGRKHAVDLDHLEAAEQQIFLKVSYAFQR